MQIYLTALVVGIILSVISFFSSNERAKSLRSETDFRMERTLIYAALAVAFFCCFLAIFCDVRVLEGKMPISNVLVPATIGILSAFCSAIWAGYKVNLGENKLFFGFLGKKSIKYSEIENITDVRNQGSPRIVLKTKDGKSLNLWSNLLGHDMLVEKLRERCSKKI
jgi:hypothetical protein